MSRSIILGSSISSGIYIKSSSHHEYDRCRVLSFSSGLNLSISAHKNSIYFLGRQSLIHLSHGLQRKNESKRNFAVYNSVQPGVPLPSAPPSSGPWKGWLVGIVLTFVLPFLTNKWGPLLKIKNEIDTAVQTVEDVVDAVEKVAEQVEKVAEGIADDLPAGKLKDAVTFLENVADQIDHTTEAVGDVIDKVQEAEENVETAVESALAEKKETVVIDEVKEEPAKEVKVEASAPN
ncbi:hypothetical protein ACH5RR_034637 [Cinchona calisaya]|uniref:Plastid-targeted protein 4 n=1 Tax=Cinchona calisaya TaxID=153742 RepID=A0ABD2YCT9_9GENT